MIFSVETDLRTFVLVYIIAICGSRTTRRHGRLFVTKTVGRGFSWSNISSHADNVSTYVLKWLYHLYLPTYRLYRPPNERRRGADSNFFFLFLCPLKKKTVDDSKTTVRPYRANKYKIHMYINIF